MSLTRLDAKGLRALVEGDLCSSFDLFDLFLPSLAFGDELELAKHIFIVFEGGFSLSSLTSFRFVDDRVKCRDEPFCSFRFRPLGSDDGRTQSTIFLLGVFSFNVFRLFLCSDSALR